MPYQSNSGLKALTIELAPGSSVRAMSLVVVFGTAPSFRADADQCERKGWNYKHTEFRGTKR